jgi:hypothetical protein
MAKFNVTNVAVTNLPPTEVGNVAIDILYADTSYVFVEADFTTGTTPVYSDPENDAVSTVKVVTLPTVGTLKLSAVDVIADDEITLADIVAGNLEYFIDLTDTDGYTDSIMTFNIADVGSLEYGAITDGIVTLNVSAEINLPPSSVGDITINLINGEFYTFTSANFTSETTPPYSDPESDAALNLKVLSLPADGTLKLSGIVLTVNDIVSFAEISSGLFTYVPDVSIKIIQTLTFDFAVSDVGSFEYTS